MLRMTTTLVCITSLVGFALIGNVAAECNDAGWDEKCLNLCDQTLTDCTTLAEAEYLKCVYYYHIEESICARELERELQKCSSIWADCEQTCRC